MRRQVKAHALFEGSAADDGPCQEVQCAGMSIACFVNQRRRQKRLVVGRRERAERE